MRCSVVTRCIVLLNFMQQVICCDVFLHGVQCGYKLPSVITCCAV